MSRNIKIHRILMSIISPLLIIFITLGTTASAASSFANYSAKYETGEIWVPQTSGTSNYLADADCIDQDAIWIAGFDATLLKTTNHGDDWTSVNTGVDPAKGFSALYFLDQDVGWVSGSKAVIRTLDGGANWDGIQYDSDIARTDIFGVSSSVAWVVGGESTYLYHWRYTFNADDTITTDFWASPASVEMLLGIYFIDEDNGWSVGSNGRISHITNASSDSPTFTPQTSGTTNWLEAIQMLDANTGWIVGRGGVILKTTDGGENWNPQDSGVTVDLQDLEFVDANTGLAVGKDGTILFTTNGGDTWTPETSGVGVILRGACLADPVHGFAVGQEGTILYRTTPEPETIKTFLPFLVRTGQ